MKVERFIARRLWVESNRFARSVTRIAIASIAVGLSVMIVALGIVRGYKNEITGKITGISGHIQILNYDNRSGFESVPINRNHFFYEELSELPGVAHVQVFATKNLILRKDGEIQGVICKGVGEDATWNFFGKNIIAGDILHPENPGSENEILVSALVARKLLLQPGDTVTGFYLEESRTPRFDSLPSEHPDQQYEVRYEPKGLPLRIAGIYETGLEEFDNQLIITDIRMVQKLYGWSSQQVTGFEVMVDDMDELDATYETVFAACPGELYPFSIKQLYPDIFVWLPTIDQNGIIIVVLMILVGIMAMISTLLIIILDKTPMIGILKAVGMRGVQLRKLFFYHATYILIRGILIGNVIGLSLALSEQFFKWIPMNAATYYVAYVPVEVNMTQWAILNAGTGMVILASLILPTLLAARIHPIRAIRFE